MAWLPAHPFRERWFSFGINSQLAVLSHGGTSLPNLIQSRQPGQGSDWQQHDGVRGNNLRADDQRRQHDDHEVLPGWRSAHCAAGQRGGALAGDGSPFSKRSTEPSASSVEPLTPKAQGKFWAQAKGQRHAADQRQSRCHVDLRRRESADGDVRRRHRQLRVVD